MAPNLTSLLTIAALTCFSVASPSQKVLGPAFPAPSSVVIAPAVKSAAASLAHSLQDVLTTGKNPFTNFTGSSTSVSLTAMAVGEDAAFFDFHFSSPHLNTSAGSTSKVSADSVYRIGSISKLFTVYGLLLNQGMKYWNIPVTEFIPELRNVSAGVPIHSPVEHVQWDEVTVGALASQISGIGRDYNNADLASQGFPASEAGLPVLPPQDIPTCGGNSSLPPCDRKTFFQGFNKRHPVFAPFTTPIYSNSAFVILAYVLEAITGSTFDKIMEGDVFGPLGLKFTSTSVPDVPGRGVIPIGDPDWFRDTGDTAPTAGIYSSSSDLVRFGNAILANKQLSPADTRRWMKPTAHTSALTFSVGAPWEIWRTQSRVTSGDTIDLYTKDGSDGEYDSRLILIPDLQVSFSVLAAGPDSGPVSTIAIEMALQALLPVLDQISRSEARKNFCGKYAPKVGGNNSSLVLSVDDDGPGLVVEEWIVNGSNIRDVAQEYSNTFRGGVIKSIRLYPTNLSSNKVWNKGSLGVSQVAYRAIFETVLLDFDASVPRVFATTASTWSAVDQLMYGSIAVDEFIFHLDKNGSAVAIEPRVFRDNFEKVDG